MKRYGNLYPRICSMENIELAHKNARKGKRHYPAVIKVDDAPEKYLPGLRDMLAGNRFENGNYDVFYKTGRKKNRWIYKLPYYPDRIVHHCIVQVLEPIWDGVLIRDTYSSIKNRGIHDGFRRMKKFIQDKPGTRYCLKMDVKKFYPSVDHDILKRILRKKIKCPQTLGMLDKIIDSGTGVPIGNYLSQYFGNVYLAGYDHWMKEVNKIRYYSRYCDDIVMLGSDKSRLHEMHQATKDYLRASLNLELKPGTRVFPMEAGGLDYMGYVFKHDHIRVRKSIAREFKSKVAEIRKGYQAMPVTRILNTVMSYYGWLVHADARNLWRRHVDGRIAEIVDYVCGKNQIKTPKILREST